jgi:phage terminase small subunit
MSEALEQTKAGLHPLPNKRHEDFCQHYCGDFRFNAAGAYKAAGYKPQNDHTAAVLGNELLKRADIQDRIAVIEEQLTQITKIKVLDAVQRLGIIARASMSDFLDENGQVDPERLKNSPFAPAIAECAISVSPEGAVMARIKLKDDMRALELLGLTAKKDETAQNAPAVLVVKV